MKAIMVMFDSLNRHMLEPYGCDWVHTPNFKRLAQRSVTFDNCYVGSMPCMPARRELHTGRYNFLHRSWGPLEPFDDSMPEILKNNGIHTHLVSDHYHYWEEGGANYHTKYSTWELSRGQEGDPWIGDLHPPQGKQPNSQRGDQPLNRQDWINRIYMQAEEQQPQAKTFALGLDFIERNHDCGEWFLQIETFDPHEPYFFPEKYKDFYDFDFSRSNWDWPNYTSAAESPEQAEQQEHFRYLNAALISMCDAYLGKVLDAMDRYNLWDDTMLIVNTDHGYLLGEHDWWGKCRMPFYNEIANIPFFIWDPRSQQVGEHRQALVQTIDIAPTLLEYFNLDIPPDMQGKPLRETVEADTNVHETVLFGNHGGHVNITDGRHVYMRAPVREDNSPLYQYTLMPAHMNRPFSVEELQRLEGLAEPFSFTKNCRNLKIAAHGKSDWKLAYQFGNLLFDIESDPRQQRPLDDPELELNMSKMLLEAMRGSDAPLEQYQRLDLKLLS